MDGMVSDSGMDLTGECIDVMLVPPTLTGPHTNPLPSFYFVIGSNLIVHISAKIKRKVCEFKLFTLF